MSSTDLNKQVVSRFFGGQWNWEKLAALDEMVTPDYVFHGSRGDVHGMREFREAVLSELESLEEVFVKIDDAIADGDRVAIRYTCWFENHGEVGGAYPTGRTIRLDGFAIHRLVDGKVAETWEAYDRAALLRDIAAKQHLPEQDEAAIRKAISDFLEHRPGARDQRFSDRAEIVPARGRVVHGREAIGEWLAEIEPLPDWKAADLEIEGAGDLAFVRGRYSMMIARRGEAPLKDKGRYVEIWRRQADGSWRTEWNMFNSDLAVPVPAVLQAV